MKLIKRLKTLKTCPKCSGSGHILSYEHIENGICFKCYGTGSISEFTDIYEDEKKFDILATKDDEPNKYLDENGMFDPFACLMDLCKNEN